MAAATYSSPFFGSSTDRHNRRFSRRPDSGSEGSSIIDISTTVGPSDTDEAEPSPRSEVDTRKYRMPDSPRRTTQLRVQTNGLTNTADTAITSRIPTTPRTAPSPKYYTSPRHRMSEQDTSDSDLVGSGRSRAGSSYSLSRESFTSQLSYLTSIKLPGASSLAARMSSMSSATVAARALSEVGDQIRQWTAKAAKVLDDLEAKDDVEWAAAGGREGLNDVDHAITRFDSLVRVYVISVEETQTRQDAHTLPERDMLAVVAQMEGIVKEWQRVKGSLKTIKQQTEIALEWEELSQKVLGDIGQELDALDGLVFDMEERRHKSADTKDFVDATKSIDINDLDNIVSDKPGGQTTPHNPRLSLPPPFSPTSPIEPPSTSSTKEDSSLLGLFAKMQPLRASLDFLPMTLSTFHVRGNPFFPTACIDLEKRRDSLEAQWKKLESDAEALRRELGEDRWILVFRNAGRQALKMCESVERSHNKLRDALLQSTIHNTDVTSIQRMTESYEAKKTHYVPAVERVLSIIDKGVLDRLTVNGEVLRLQSDLRRRWSALQAQLSDLDVVLEEASVNAKNQELRDSVSTILSSERSLFGTGIETPKSSPASSVVLNSRKNSFNSTSTASLQRPNFSKGLSAIPRVSTPSRLGFPRTPSSRAVSSPFPRISEPYTGKRVESFREFKDPLDKPRWSLGGGSSSTSAKRLPQATTSTTRASPRSETPSGSFRASPRKYTSQIPVPSPLGQRSESPSPYAQTGGKPATPMARRAQTSMGHRISSMPSHSTQPWSAQTPRPRQPAERSSTPSLPSNARTMKGRRNSSLLALPPVTTTANGSGKDDQSIVGEEDDGNNADTEGKTPRSVSRLSRPMSRLDRPGSALAGRSKNGFGPAGRVSGKPGWRG